MLEIMRCNLCGKLAMIIRDGGRRTICCDQLMEKLVEQGTVAKGAEGHVPLIEKKGTGILVKVPGVASPMEEGHSIEWIEVTEGKKLQVMGLSPGDAPEAEFAGAGPGSKARIYCEEHGLWTNRTSKPKG